MIEIKEVKTKKDIKKFVDFPTKLYRGVKQYVHPLRGDELNLFNENKNVSFEDCDAIYFLAYKDGELAGRICGLVQKRYNEKVNENRVRFTRFDSVNDVEVAKALFEAVENWAKEMGMDIVHWPMGFNDLDREGMLIEGFDEIATFEEQYNFDYYKDLMIACGYAKEVDWLEFNLVIPQKIDDKVLRVSELVKKRYELRLADKNSKSKFIKKYKEGIFKVIDEAYGDLYGVVPYTPKVRDQIIAQFKLFINMDFMSVIVDKDNNVVAFGFAIPSLSEAINACEGRLTPSGLIKLLKAIRKPTQLDLALIAVKPEYQSKGVTALIFTEMLTSFIKRGITNCETNLNLEDNIKIQLLWKDFEHRQHKRRRSWIKHLDV